MNIATIKTDFENCKLMKVFEVEVIDKRTNETDYITFDIDIVKNSLIAQHIGLTDKQERSKKNSISKNGY